MERIAEHYTDNVRWFDETLGAGRSCDMVCRDLQVGGRRGRIWVIDGFGGDAILERMGAFWLSLKPEQVGNITQMQDFVDRFVTFMEVNVSFDRDDIVTSVLLGKSLLLLEGVQGAALIDAKDYPTRGVAEPLDGKVLRGAHDGFIEAVVPTAGAGPGEAAQYQNALFEHGAGKCFGKHPPQAVVQSLSQGPLYRAARYRRRLRHGGVYHHDGGQFPLGDDPAHLLL